MIRAAAMFRPKVLIAAIAVAATALAPLVLLTPGADTESISIINERSRPVLAVPERTTPGAPGVVGASGPQRPIAPSQPASVGNPAVMRQVSTLAAGPAPSATQRRIEARIIPSGLARSGIPDAALRAYRNAAATLAKTTPGCRMSWTLLAAIGRVESNHGRFGGAVLSRDGRSVPPILGVRLDGGGTAVIRDSDGGVLDGDSLYDRAVGSMQFLPGTWASVGRDGDGDRRADPQDIDDAALSAGVYLCMYGADMSKPGDLRRAIWRYNHSEAYVELVVGLAAVYAGKVTVVSTPVVPVTPVPTVAPGTPAAPGTAGTPGTSGSPGTPTASPTPATPKPSPKPSAPPSPTPSASPTPSPTDSATPTPSPTDSATPTPSPSEAPTPSESPSPSNTPTPTDCPTEAPTPEPTDTPAPDPSPTPSCP